MRSITQAIYMGFFIPSVLFGLLKKGCIRYRYIQCINAKKQKEGIT